MIPVDEPNTGAVPDDRHERVLSPQVAVQERVRSPRFLQDLCPPGSVRERGVQPIEQTISYRHRLCRRLVGGPGQRFEASDGIGDVLGLRVKLREPQVGRSEPRGPVSDCDVGRGFSDAWTGYGSKHCSPVIATADPFSSVAFSACGSCMPIYTAGRMALDDGLTT